MINSISRIKLFKSCRRAYELKYIYRLEPVDTSDALRIGTNFHQLIENLNRTGEFEPGYDREHAMATAYKLYIYPKVKVKSPEKWLEYSVAPGQTLIGRADGIADDGRLVEYKTTGAEIGPEYEYNLQWDEQMLAYMLMSGAREIYYVVIRKPTIRIKKGETEDEFFERMVSWYAEDTDSKIKMMLISRTDAEIMQFAKDLADITQEMSHTKLYYRNTNYCNCWGRRCEYSSVCLNYDPNQEYIEFTKGV